MNKWHKLTKEQRQDRSAALKRYRAKERTLETEEEQEIRMSKYKEEEEYSSSFNHRPHHFTEEEYNRAIFDSEWRAYCREEDRFSKHF